MQLATYNRKLSELGRNYQIYLQNPPRRAIFSLHKLLKRNTIRAKAESDPQLLLFRVLSKKPLVDLQKMVEKELRSLLGGKSFKIVKRSKRILTIRID